MDSFVSRDSFEYESMLNCLEVKKFEYALLLKAYKGDLIMTSFERILIMVPPFP